VSVLRWISDVVRDAVLRGFAEAAQELKLTEADTGDTAGALADLRSRIALPAPEDSGKDT
jgi:hypothetical protein